MRRARVIRSTQILQLFLLASLLPGCPKLLNGVEEYNKTQKAELESKTALRRASTGCVLTIDSETGAENYMKVNQPARDLTDKKLLRPGMFICNTLGDTAVVDDFGHVSDIARIVDSDRHEYLLKLEGVPETWKYEDVIN